MVVLVDSVNEMINNIQLTQLQQRHYESVKWLINDNLSNRRSGRTFLMAYILLEQGIDNVGTWVSVQDHFAGAIATRRVLLETLIELFNTSFGYENKCGECGSTKGRGTNTFTLTIQHNYHRFKVDWK